MTTGASLAMLFCIEVSCIDLLLACRRVFSMRWCPCAAGASRPEAGMSREVCTWHLISR